MDARAQAWLEDGETHHASFYGTSGPSPMWMFVSSIIYLFKSQGRLVLVTDKAVYLCTGSSFRVGRPKQVIEEFPLGTDLIRADSNMYGKVQIDSHHLWVHQRFEGDVLRAHRLSNELAAELVG